jgi:hypothetical protein
MLIEITWKIQSQLKLTKRDIYSEEQLTTYVEMSRLHTSSYYCEVCHAPNCKDSPIIAMHDGAVKICMNCYLREIDRGKAIVASAQRDVVADAQ